MAEPKSQPKHGKVYKDGEFFIGSHHIERWDPRKLRYPGDGLFINKVSGKFEVWSRGIKLSETSWKQDMRALIFWANRNGFDY